MEHRVITEEVNQDEESRFSSMFKKIFEYILEKGNVSEDDKNKVNKEIFEQYRDKPFRVAIIGQSGVGKSSTLNHVFGLDLPTSDIDEGTTEVIEKIFPKRDGLNLAVYDMPGLLQSRKKDSEYYEMYKEILPQCDIIVYIIKANTRNIGDDCKILKEIVLPICNTNGIKDNLIIAINKVDIIGESVDANDEELQWDVIENRPTKKLAECINQKRLDIYHKLIDEGLVLLNADKVLNPEQIVFYSAVYDYNLSGFMKAIANAGNTGWFWILYEGMDHLKKVQGK